MSAAHEGWGHKGQSSSIGLKHQHHWVELNQRSFEIRAEAWGSIESLREINPPAGDKWG